MRFLRWVRGGKWRLGRYRMGKEGYLEVVVPGHVLVPRENMENSERTRPGKPT